MSRPTTRRRFLRTVGAVGSVGAVSNLAGARRPGREGQEGRRRQVAFVANKKGGTISLVDATTFEKLKTINTVPDGKQPSPSEDPSSAAGARVANEFAGENFAEHVSVAPDGAEMYVSRGHRGDLAAFDVATGEMRWKLDIPGFRSDHMTLSPDGQFLFVSAMTDNSIQIVDTGGPAIVDSFPAEHYPHGIHLTHDRSRVINGSLGNMLVPDNAEDESTDARQADRNHRLTVADAQTREVEAVYEFSDGIRPFTLTEDDSRIFLQLSYFHGFVEFDLDRGRRLRTVQLPVGETAQNWDRNDYPSEAAHHGIQLSPDGEYVCCAGMVDGYVALVSRPSLQVDTILDVGGRPGWAKNGPRGTHCFIADRQQNEFVAVSYTSRDVAARVPVGDSPAVIDVEAVPESVLF
jgi:DNA-binding beta-propeller fold protein YncE